MQNDSAEENELTMRLTKAGRDYEIRVSREDEDLFRLYKWSLLIGRNGHLYLHRTEKKKKIYFSRSVLERKLAHPLEKGESCLHLDGNSANKTRDNLGLKLSKALRQTRGL